MRDFAASEQCVWKANQEPGNRPHEAGHGQEMSAAANHPASANG